MKISIIVMCLLSGMSAAFAQTGVSNQRDKYGNLVHNGGDYATRGLNQGPSNNGPIRIAPTQPSTSSTAGKIQQINR
jgi:hypothetical protein